MNLDNFDWQEELIDKIRKEQYAREENERKYLESISSASYYDLIDVEIKFVDYQYIVDERIKRGYDFKPILY